MTRLSAADDFTAIRARLEELRREPGEGDAEPANRSTIGPSIAERQGERALPRSILCRISQTGG